MAASTRRTIWCPRTVSATRSKARRRRSIALTRWIAGSTSGPITRARAQPRKERIPQEHRMPAAEVTAGFLVAPGTLSVCRYLVPRAVGEIEQHAHGVSNAGIAPVASRRLVSYVIEADGPVFVG